ncbi:MAG: hypothetical protein IPO87_16930 [Flavobacteriales bacterium]|nr:hypothetical protein [Flavobacteriales bacterium]
MMQDRTIQSMLTRLWCATSEPAAVKRTRSLGAMFSLALFLLMGVTAIAQTIGAGALTSGTNENGNPIYRSVGYKRIRVEQEHCAWTAGDLAALPGHRASIRSPLKANAFTIAAGGRQR